MSESTYSPEFASLQRVVAGRYSLVREVGRGGMGIVFLARDVALDRPVAIKLLPPELAIDVAYRERFLREARMAASLAHPNIVPIHSVESHEDVVCFVMAFIDGESLGQMVRRRGRLGTTESVRIMQEVAWAISHAHARGIVHRDVKPDNILLEKESGRVLVTDFGIARAVTGTTGGHEAPAGTPHYLSPEQARGELGDARSDVYALGVTTWYALTGGHPFHAPNVTALLMKQSAERAPSIASVVPELPTRFGKVIDRCLERLPADRWASAEELAGELNAVRARIGDLPAPVRAWVREVLPAGNDIGMGFGGVATSAAAWMLLEALSGGGRIFGSMIGGQPIGPALDILIIRAIMTISALLFGGLAIGRLGSVVAMTRNLVESGHDHAIAKRALAELEIERASEKSETSGSERKRRAFRNGLIGSALSALMIWLAFDQTTWIYLPATVLSVLVPMLTIRSVQDELSTGKSLWSKMLRGRFGRGLFKFARTLTRQRPIAVAVDQPTVAALGLEAEQLFGALPPDVRDQLQDLPHILATLRQEAERLRVSRDDVANARLSSVVAAMEAVRLELMAMNAGLRSVPDVTRNLEEVRRISERVDRALKERDATPSGHGKADLLESTPP